MYRELDSVTKRVEGAVYTTEKMAEPIRRSVLKRFPIILALLVAFGVSATYFGIERIIMQIAWLNERPFLIFFLGLCALILSGKLYQKLG